MGNVATDGIITCDGSDISGACVASHRGIARSLNARGVTTARGGVWTAVQVGSILRRVE
jgi:hypothetical protein